MLQHGPTGCNRVQHGATWCNMEQHGATGCNMVQQGATWCNMVQVSATWCHIVEHGATELLSCHTICSGIKMVIMILMILTLMTPLILTSWIQGAAFSSSFALPRLSLPWSQQVFLVIVITIINIIIAIIIINICTTSSRSCLQSISVIIQIKVIAITRLRRIPPNLLDNTTNLLDLLLHSNRWPSIHHWRC